MFGKFVLLDFFWRVYVVFGVVESFLGEVLLILKLGVCLNGCGRCVEVYEFVFLEFCLLSVSFEDIVGGILWWRMGWMIWFFEVCMRFFWGFFEVVNYLDWDRVNIFRLSVSFEVNVGGILCCRMGLLSRCLFVCFFDCLIGLFVRLGDLNFFCEIVLVVFLNERFYIVGICGIVLLLYYFMLKE